MISKRYVVVTGPRPTVLAATYGHTVIRDVELGRDRVGRDQCVFILEIAADNPQRADFLAEYQSGRFWSFPIPAEVFVSEDDAQYEVAKRVENGV